MQKEAGYVKWFSELSNKDVPIAGGKGASLAEMYNNKFPIPPGFMITAQAYRYFIEKTGLAAKIKEMLSHIDIEDTKELDRIAKSIRTMIDATPLPEDLAQEIREAYDILDVNKDHYAGAKAEALSILKKSKEVPFVAVRSSATTEDLADASFAGQQESFLNVKGNSQLLKKVVECFASLFNARAIYYRTQKGFAHEKSYLAVVVQKMINSDKSGVMFSKNPVKDDNMIVIEAVWGLGEGIVSGMIKPDHYEIDKNLENFNVSKTEVPEKKVAIVRDSGGNTITVKLTEDRAKQQVMNSFELKTLAQYALKLEEHYGKPQDIEFAISGRDIYIVQSRPITTHAKAEGKEVSGDVLLSGFGASPGIASGVVKIVKDLSELDKVKKGDVLVTIMTNPDMVVSMQKAAAIITDEGGVTSHAAIVSREMGIPAVVGTVKATSELKEGMIVTVDGNRGMVYEGKGETKLAEIKQIVPTKTRIKLIVDLPDFAERAALSGSRAVGLTRLEGIIAESGKHPLYYVKKGQLNSYTKLLFESLKKLSAPFDEVWIRTSDIRSDEFRHLEGSVAEVEGNPMLGNHGIRFSVKNKGILDAEVAAIQKLAEAYPEKKFGIMAPQIISVDEVRAVKEAAERAKVGDNVKVGIMVETPAAVQIINQICEEGIQFVSFGTNDLTQYILAIDRNNESIQDLYNEMNPAVLSAISYVIRRCKKYGVETSICGQAGSKPEMARFLVSEGIDSISVNADAAYAVSNTVAEIESQRVQGIIVSEDVPAARHERKERNVEPMVTARALEITPISGVVIDPEQEFAAMAQAAYADSLKPTPSNEEVKDIEEVILKELDKGEYNPGLDKASDVPSLNDAIPVSSEHFEETKEHKEVSLE